MNESETEHFKQHLRVYLTVFVALAVLTVVTVGISYLDLATGYAITIAMIVATVKASLVAGYFMHLVSEQRVIHWVLILSAAFLVFWFVLPLVTETSNGPLWPL